MTTFKYWNGSAFVDVGNSTTPLKVRLGDGTWKVFDGGGGIPLKYWNGTAWVTITTASVPLVGTDLQSQLDAFTTTDAQIKDRIWGTYAESGGRDGTLYELTSLTTLEAAIASGYKFTIVSGYMDSTLETGFLNNMKTIANRGGGLNISYDIEWTFASILAGTHDAALNAHAASFATVNGPVYLRMWAEMNGDWATWSARYSGSGAQAASGTQAAKHTQWINAWKHVVDLYRASAADNVRFVWNPNNVDEPDADNLEDYWPGNTYVDVLGVDAYNFGQPWQTFDDIFSECYGRVTALGTTGQPVWLGEFGSREPSVVEVDSEEGDTIPIDSAHSKGTWVNDMMGSTSYPRLQALCYFDVQKERHWQMQSSTTSLNAFKAGLTS